LLIFSNANAQDSVTLRNIVTKFGNKYSQQEGIHFADNILHKYVSAMDGGRHKGYDSMHKLIAETWAGMNIKYNFNSITDDGCVGEVKVIEITSSGEKWDSTFIFVRGGFYGWRLMLYHSNRL
jgi:hypothetical protein